MDAESGKTQRLELTNWPPFFICISAVRSKGVIEEIDIVVANYPLGHGDEDEDGAMANGTTYRHSIKLLTI
jgi:hypothetical protein